LKKDIEDSQEWHGKPLGAKSEASIEAVEKLIVEKTSKLAFELLPIQKPVDKVEPVDISNIKLSTPPKYELGQKMATREAYGNGLVKIGENNKQVIACDGDMKNSTFSLKFRNTFPDRFIECFIAEQNLAGVAIGCATRDRHVVFASTFAAFWARAYDQIRMGAVSLTNVNFAGSHVGCSIGEDGPSQMALEDIAMFRALPESTVFYPSDAVSTEYAVQLAANTKGICYIRLSRPATPVIYSNEEVFEVGKAKVVVKSASDYATVVAGGVTVSELKF
jgi:transketolase